MNAALLPGKIEHWHITRRHPCARNATQSKSSNITAIKLHFSRDKSEAVSTKRCNQQSATSGDIEMHPIAQPFMIWFTDTNGKVRAGKAIECDQSGDVFKVLRTGGIDRGATEQIDSSQIIDSSIH